MELFFDTETSDLIKWKLPLNDKSQPWIVQIGAILSDENVKFAELNLLIRPCGREISANASRVHHITTDLAEKCGVEEEYAMQVLFDLMNSADTIIAHNIDFDASMIECVCEKSEVDYPSYPFKKIPTFCTMKKTTTICNLPGKFGPKWPKLDELHMHLFGEHLVGAHDAMYDIKATRDCFYELKRRKLCGL